MTATHDKQLEYARNHRTLMRTTTWTGEEEWHGTPNGYSNRLCRCDRCRAAWAEAVQKAKEQRAERPIPEHVHGTQNGYGNYHCRCGRCRTAWSKASTERARRRKASAGR